MKAGTQRLGRVVLFVLGGLVVVLMTVRSSVASLHRANGSSDAPTIRNGELFLVNRLAFDLRLPLTGIRLARLAEPSRGDLVLFSMPGSRKLATKRVVAIPGDVVEVRAGRILLNGTAARYRSARANGVAPDGSSLTLIEEWSGRWHLVICSTDASANEPSTVMYVPVGHYFVLGDNREHSLDSRHFGPVPRDDIQGRVAIRGRSASGH